VTPDVPPPQAFEDFHKPAEFSVKKGTEVRLSEEIKESVDEVRETCQ